MKTALSEAEYNRKLKELDQQTEIAAQKTEAAKKFSAPLEALEKQRRPFRLAQHGLLIVAIALPFTTKRIPFLHNKVLGTQLSLLSGAGVNYFYNLNPLYKASEGILKQQEKLLNEALMLQLQVVDDKLKMIQPIIAQSRRPLPEAPAERAEITEHNCDSLTKLSSREHDFFPIKGESEHLKQRLIDCETIRAMYSSGIRPPALYTLERQIDKSLDEMRDRSFSQARKVIQAKRHELLHEELVSAQQKNTR